MLERVVARRFIVVVPCFVIVLTDLDGTELVAFLVAGLVAVVVLQHDPVGLVLLGHDTQLWKLIGVDEFLGIASVDARSVARQRVVFTPLGAFISPASRLLFHEYCS